MDNCIKDIPKCIKLTKEKCHKINKKVYKCNDFFVKLSIYSMIIEEYNNYKILNDIMPELIYRFPIFYEDKYGKALIFNNEDKLENLNYYMVNNHIEFIKYLQVTYVLINKLINKGYGHGDLHFGNIICNKGNIYLIDLETFDNDIRPDKIFINQIFKYLQTNNVEHITGYITITF